MSGAVVKAGRPAAENAGRPADVLEVVPDAVFAVGGRVRLDGRRVTFMPEGLSGWVAVNCYVLASDGHVLIVDGGLGCHVEEILAGLDGLTRGARRIDFIMTRREPDALGNLPAILKRYPVHTVYYSGEVSPLDFFETFDATVAHAHLKTMFSGRLAMLEPGMSIPVGQLSVEVIRTSLRVLATYWLYETTTRSLFTSDSFGWALAPGDGGSFVAAPDAVASSDQALQFLEGKFDWLCGIDTGPIARDVAAVFEARRVDRICPGFGGIAEGMEDAGAMRDAVADALSRIAKRPFRHALDGNWPGK